MALHLWLWGLVCGDLSPVMFRARDLKDNIAAVLVLWNRRSELVAPAFGDEFLLCCGVFLRFFKQELPRLSNGESLPDQLLIVGFNDG